MTPVPRKVRQGREEYSPQGDAGSDAAARSVPLVPVELSFLLLHASSHWYNDPVIYRPLAFLVAGSLFVEPLVSLGRHQEVGDLPHNEPENHRPVSQRQTISVVTSASSSEHWSFDARAFKDGPVPARSGIFTLA